MVTTLLFIATYVEAVSETLLAVNPLYFVIVATYGLTVAYALALRFRPRWTLQVYAQLAGDLLTITALVYMIGGWRTGFLLLYPLSVLSATLLLRRRATLSFAGIATVLWRTSRCFRHGRRSTRSSCSASPASRSPCWARRWPRACSTPGLGCRRPPWRWPTCGS
jgi:hypothetical protein